MLRLMTAFLASLAGFGWGCWLVVWWSMEYRDLVMTVPKQVVRLLVGFQSLMFGTAIVSTIVGAGQVFAAGIAWGIPALLLLDAAILLTMKYGLKPRSRNGQ
jgi:hypothetical protein